MTPTSLDDLLRLARAATPGPWRQSSQAVEWVAKQRSPFVDQGASIEQDDDCFHYADGSSSHLGPLEESDGEQHSVPTIVVGGAQDEQGGAVGVLRNDDAAFIAAASPSVIEALVRVAQAAEDFSTYDGAEPEPCWRCGGGGSHCEERMGDLETCRCCGGSGEHCQTVVGPGSHQIACIQHNPKQRESECQMEPEMAVALAALSAVLAGEAGREGERQ